MHTSFVNLQKHFASQMQLELHLSHTKLAKYLLQKHFRLIVQSLALAMDDKKQVGRYGRYEISTPILVTNTV